MPFCRECGKEVQTDWATCPYCSESIGPPVSNSIELQDSVVMGNVAMNDTSSISDAMQTATKCVSCSSTGVTQITCASCRDMSHCSVCKDEMMEERRIIIEGGHRRGADYEFVEHLRYYLDTSDVMKLASLRLCDVCFSIKISSEYNKCSNCNVVVVPRAINHISSEEGYCCTCHFWYEKINPYDDNCDASKEFDLRRKYYLFIEAKG